VGALATSISLSVDPTSLPETGGTVQLIALVRDDQGQPLPDASVNFRTEAGSLASGGAFLTTDANGQATDTLEVSAADVQSQPDRLITVTVESGGTGGVISASKDISIQGPPVASFTFTVTGFFVSFRDTSTGNPTSWRWDFGDGSPVLLQQNPAHDFSQAGQGELGRHHHRTLSDFARDRPGP